MNLASATLLFVSMVCTAVLSAQKPPAMPKPGPEHKRLEYFVGTWSLEGETKPSPFGPGGKITVTEKNEWMPGGFFLVSHSDAKTPAGNAIGLSVMGYDPEEKRYTYNEFNSMGESVACLGTVDGEIWTWTSSQKMGGQTMKSRFIVKQTSATSYNFKFEMAPESGDFSTVMEGKATKGR